MNHLKSSQLFHAHVGLTDGRVLRRMAATAQIDCGGGGRWAGCGPDAARHVVNAGRSGSVALQSIDPLSLPERRRPPGADVTLGCRCVRPSPFSNSTGRTTTYMHQFPVAEADGKSRERERERVHVALLLRCSCRCRCDT